MNIVRKKILLVWWYDRKDLIAPFLQMQEGLDITVLFYRFKEQENAEVAESIPFKRIYWTDFLSPYQILNSVKPDKILFFGTEDMLATSLIVAAKIKKITTCYVSHGLRGNLSEVLASFENKTENKIERYSVDNPYYNRKKWHSILFLLTAFSFRRMNSLLFVLNCFFISLKEKNAFIRLLKLQNDIRKPDFYFLYAKSNATLFQELDHATSEKIKYTGPYMMDAIFKDLANANRINTSPYWLLIDQPLASIKRENKIEFYKKISLAASLKGRKLYVKLHPMEYDVEYLENDNIIWVKQTDSLNELIINAEGCLGYHSALLLPIIPIKKCILFNPENVSLTYQWAELGVLKLLDFETFSLDEINFNSFEITDVARHNFVEQYISFQDGNCTERLRKLILS